MSEFVINAEHQPPREINRAIRKAATEYDKITIKNPNATHYLAAGLVDPVELVIDGSAGYFAGTMIHGAKIHITENAGWFPGDNMTEGEVIIDGSAGDGVGQGIYGGTVVVKTGRWLKNRRNNEKRHHNCWWKFRIHEWTIHDGRTYNNPWKHIR